MLQGEAQDIGMFLDCLERVEGVEYPRDST